MNLVGNFPQVSHQEKVRLFKAAQSGDLSAHEQLILSCVPLAIHIAQRYIDRGMDLEDLVAEGIIGLLRAAESYDEKRGASFATHAGYRIKGRILQALRDKASVVRVPAWRQIHYRVPTVSLDEPLSEGSDGTLAEQLPALEPEEAIDPNLLEQMKQLLESALILTRREQLVIKGFFGIGEARQRAPVIAARLGITLTWVYVLRNKALAKLRRKLEREIA